MEHLDVEKLFEDMRQIFVNNIPYLGSKENGVGSRQNEHHKPFSVGFEMLK
jgi:hypothetical protein